jgi:hypothetical protein
MIGAVCGRIGDVPRGVREHVLSSVPSIHLLDAWRPMRRSATHNFVPDIVAPDWQGDISVAQCSQWLVQHGPDELVRQITEAGNNAGAWSRELADPSRWLSAYVSASLATWDAITPLWLANQKSLEAEMTRIGLAQARGASYEVLNTIHPAIGFHCNSLLVPNVNNKPYEVRLRDRPLNLVPMVAASERWYVSSGNPEAVTAGGTSSTSRRCAQHRNSSLRPP